MRHCFLKTNQSRQELIESPLLVFGIFVLRWMNYNIKAINNTQINIYIYIYIYIDVSGMGGQESFVITTIPWNEYHET